MSEDTIRTFNYDTDYERVMDLWRSAGAGIQLRRSDEPDEIKKKLDYHPDLFLVYESEEEIVGAVLGGFDGRRGLMYHLSVAERFRKKGIASLLVDELEKRLKQHGCIRYYLLVTPDNTQAIDFYEHRGWGKLDLLVYARDLE